MKFEIKKEGDEYSIFIKGVNVLGEFDNMCLFRGKNKKMLQRVIKEIKKEPEPIFKEDLGVLGNRGLRGEIFYLNWHLRTFNSDKYRYHLDIAELNNRERSLVPMFRVIKKHSTIYCGYSKETANLIYDKALKEIKNEKTP